MGIILPSLPSYQKKLDSSIYPTIHYDQLFLLRRGSDAGSRVA